MRSLRLLSLVAFAGCASGGGLEPASTPPRILNTGTGYDISVASGGDAPTALIRASPEAAWRALPGVFAALEILPEHIDADRMIIGNLEHVARRTLGSEPLSRYLSCGSTISGAIANSYEVRLLVVSQLMAAQEGRTQIRTRVGATARSRDGASSSPVPCGTTGRLEARIAELLNRSVGG